MKKYSAKDITIMAAFVAVGFILQYAESRILITGIPGAKLGLANVVSIINIFVFGGRNAILISSLRAVLASVVSAGVSTLPYSLCGAFFSTLAMVFAKKYFFPSLSIIGISITGAVVHNIVQLLVAFFQYGSAYVFSYLPGLLIMALISGTITGYTAKIFAERALKEKLK